MEEIKYWLKPENFEVVAYYPYTSIINLRFLSQSHNYKTVEHEMLNEFGNKIKEMAINKGCRWDNKVVVELKYKNTMLVENSFTSNIFVGFKDGLIHVGLGYYQPDSYTKEHNVIF